VTSRLYQPGLVPFPLPMPDLPWCGWAGAGLSPVALLGPILRRIVPSLFPRTEAL
jgi:hypothetical protein